MDERAQKSAGFFLGLFISTLASAEPTPYCRVSVKLAEQPLPVTVSVQTIPQQQAQANTAFLLNLKPYLTTSQIDTRYLVTNTSFNLTKETSGITATSYALSNLPNGVNQVATRSGDCSFPFVLTQNQSCYLHLVVDKNRFTTAANATGPLLGMQVCWNWGKKKNHHGCQNVPGRLGSGERLSTVFASVDVGVQAQVYPAAQEGLSYDPITQSIVGTPTRSGMYVFSVAANNSRMTSAPQPLLINVDINLKDKPIFKPYYSLASAMPEQDYQLNLMDLIEPMAGFAVTNQVHFRIDPERPHPTWLTLDNDTATRLQGRAPLTDVGLTREITLIATSNTGGDSLPMTLGIPIAFDPAKKPVIASGIELTGEAGHMVSYDFSTMIKDIAQDNQLKLILDTVEPEAPWLKVDLANPTRLEGLVPLDAVGQTYQLTLYANSRIGGNSDRVTVPLQIAIDPTLTPHFYSGHPSLPLIYAGQPYAYQFEDHYDIVPDFNTIPYTVELATGYSNPPWVRIENNQLLIDKVPDDLNESPLLYITINNRFGGQSPVLTLPLTLMQKSS